MSAVKRVFIELACFVARFEFRMCLNTWAVDNETPQCRIARQGKGIHDFERL